MSFGTTEDPTAHAAPQRIGRYEILGEIARGGMGVVYRARDPQIGRDVALKVMLGADPEELLRFQQEAQSAGGLRHPNIVAVFDAGVQRGQPYMVMDLVEGESLSGIVKRDGPLEVATAARLTERLARALDYAHGQGVVHRDLKPANVLLDQRGEPQLTDFGLAKATDVGAQGLTVTGVVLGTPSYMAPEQALGDVERIGPTSDVYGLGATLYELLTGRPPFEGNSALGIMAAVIDQDPSPPRKLRPEVHVDLETICLKCLEKEPIRRYASAQALADDLGRFVRHEPILARPPSAIERSARFFRRHRVALAAFALGSFLAVGAALGVVAPGREQARLRVQLDEAIANKAQARVDALATQAIALEEADVERGRLFCERAVARLALKKPYDAVADFERALSLDPGLVLEERCAEAYVRRGVDKETKGDLESATSDYLRALELAPAHAEALFHCGACLVALKRYREALAYLDRYVALFPQSRKAPDDLAVVLWRRARAKERLDDFMGAMRDASASIRMNPKDPRAYRVRADVRMRLKDPEGAFEDAERAVALDPEDWLGQHQHGLSLTALGRGEEALEAFGRSLERRASSEAYLARGLLLSLLGRKPAALADANAALGLRPDDPGALVLRARVVVRERPADALRDCERSLALDPKNAPAHFVRGAALVRLGRVGEAESSLREALNCDPNMAVALLALGRIWLGNGSFVEAHRASVRVLLDSREGSQVHREALELRRKIEQECVAKEGRAGAVKLFLAAAAVCQEAKRHDFAEDLLDHALELDPRNGSALLQRGLARQARGDHERAALDFESVLRIHPRSTHAMLGRARAFLARGRTTAALADVKKALQLLPANHGLRPEAEALLRDVQAARAAEQQR